MGLAEKNDNGGIIYEIRVYSAYLISSIFIYALLPFLFMWASIPDLKPTVFPPSNQKCCHDNHSVYYRRRLKVQKQFARQMYQSVVGKSCIEQNRA